jgi:hypothetical protein
MREEEETITCNFYSREVRLKVDPALLDAIEQDMKLYGWTYEEVLCTGFNAILDQHPDEDIFDIDFDNMGITFLPTEFDKEMSFNEFVFINSNDSEIRGKQLDTLYKMKANMDFCLYVKNQIISALEKRIAWTEKNENE